MMSLCTVLHFVNFICPYLPSYLLYVWLHVSCVSSAQWHVVMGRSRGRLCATPETTPSACVWTVSLTPSESVAWIHVLVSVKEPPNITSSCLISAITYKNRIILECIEPSSPWYQCRRWSHYPLKEFPSHLNYSSALSPLFSAEGSSDLNKNGNILIQWLSRPNPNFPKISSRKTSLYSSQPGLHSDSRSCMSVLCWALPISVLLSLQGRPRLAPWTAPPSQPVPVPTPMSERQSFRFSFWWEGGDVASLSLCVWDGSDWGGGGLWLLCVLVDSLLLCLSLYLSLSPLWSIVL